MSNVYSVDQLKEAVSVAICWTDVCRTLGVTVCTFNFKRMQKLCSQHNISYDHYDLKKAYRRNKKPEWTPEELFVENCTVTRALLRPLCIRFGLYTGECAECGISDNWNGKPLTIEIDHINGICTDNRKSNLRWLCPNCHSQTNTYRRRTANRSSED